MNPAPPPPLQDTAGRRPCQNVGHLRTVTAQGGGGTVMRCRRSHKAKRYVRRTCQCPFAGRRRTRAPPTPPPPHPPCRMPPEKILPETGSNSVSEITASFAPTASVRPPMPSNRFATASTATATAFQPPAEFRLRKGAVVGGGVQGGAVGGTPPPSGDPELLEAPKKFFGPN